MRRRRAALLLATALLALLAGACTSATATAPPASTATPSLAPLPRDSSRPVDPNFDRGQSVEITATTVVPLQLIAAAGFPVVWINHSGATQDIHFDNVENVDSGPIPPNGTWSYTTKLTISIVYHSTTDPSIHGAVQMQPLTEP